MRQPVHAMRGAHREMTPERIVGIGFVGLLHVIAIWAIVSGLGQKIARAVEPHDLVVVQTKLKSEPPPPAPPKPPTPELATSTTPLTPPPIIDIAREQPATITATLPPPTSTQTPPSSDSGASAIAGTHTTPPYPPIERKLGDQGTVKLRLTISPQGIVTAADIVQSSGFPGLDQAAMSWVMSHWKYKPAIQGGVPATSTTVAAVVFNLRSAGG